MVVTVFPSISSGITISVTVSSQPVMATVSSSSTLYVTVPPVASKVPVSPYANALDGRIPISRHMAKNMAITLCFFIFIPKPPFPLSSLIQLSASAVNRAGDYATA